MASMSRSDGVPPPRRSRTKANTVSLHHDAEVSKFKDPRFRSSTGLVDSSSTRSDRLSRSKPSSPGRDLLEASKTLSKSSRRLRPLSAMVPNKIAPPTMTLQPPPSLVTPSLGSVGQPVRKPVSVSPRPRAGSYPPPGGGKCVIKVLFPTENNVFKSIGVNDEQMYAEVVNMLIAKATKGMFPEEKKKKLLAYRTWELLVEKKDGTRSPLSHDDKPYEVQHRLQNTHEFDKFIFQPSGGTTVSKRRFGSVIRQQPEATKKYSSVPPPLTNQDSFLLQALQMQVESLEHKEKMLKNYLEELKSKEANVWLDLNEIVFHREMHGDTSTENRSYEVGLDRWKCMCREVTVPSNESALHDIESELFYLESLPSHPNIVHYLYHTIRDGKIHMYTSSFSTSLSKHLRNEIKRGRKQVAVADAIFIANEIAEGVEFLNKHYIFNCELDSDTVYVRYERKTNRVLGVAIGNYDRVKRTAENNPLGKIPTAYLPAEHYSGHGSSSNPSARLVFAFGMVLYEVLAGHRPYQGMDPAQIRDAIVAGKRPTLPPLGPEYKKLIDLFEGCTALAVDDRPTLSKLRVTVLNLT